MLSKANIESELSYAFLHAVASHAGFCCEVSGRHSDGAGVDATIKEDGRLLSVESKLTYVVCDVQLKASFQEMVETDGLLSYSLPLQQYDKLRSIKLSVPRLLVLFRLPRDPEEWLRVSPESLVAKRCAFWVSLRDAPAVTDQANRTVYIPTANLLTPESLTDLMARFSRQEDIPYAN